MKRVLVRRHWRSGLPVRQHYRISVRGGSEFKTHVRSFLTKQPMAFQPGKITIEEVPVKSMGRMDALGKSVVHFKGESGGIRGGIVMIRKGMPNKEIRKTLAHENAHWMLDNISPNIKENVHEVIARQAEADTT